MEILFPVYVKRIITALNEAGYSAYAVGGCIRDSLLGRVPNDWDVTTSALPSEVKDSLTPRGFDVRMGSGVKHGTVTVIVRDENEVFACEVTTFRCDGEYSDRRRPDRVEFVSSVEEDLARRDFTVNAMASDGGGIIDPFGGQEDLKRGVIRCVGDPVKRFGEDALRILRGLRFSARFGFEIERETLFAMKRLARTVSSVSRERIAAELMGIIAATHGPAILARYSDVIGTAVGSKISKFYARRCGDTDDTTVRFALIFGKDAPWVARELKMPTFIIRCLDSMLLVPRMELPFTRSRVKRIMREYPGFYGRMFEYGTFVRRDRGAFEEAIRISEEIVRSGECYTIAGLAVGGDEMKAVGLHGRDVGKALMYLLEAVCDGDIENDREILIKKAEEFYKNQKKNM